MNRCDYLLDLMRKDVEVIEEMEETVKEVKCDIEDELKKAKEKCDLYEELYPNDFQ